MNAMNAEDLQVHISSTPYHDNITQLAYYTQTVRIFRQISEIYSLMSNYSTKGEAGPSNHQFYDNIKPWPVPNDYWVANSYYPYPYDRTPGNS